MIALLMALVVRDGVTKATAAEDSAKDYHVAPSGSDENPGSRDKPFQTISKAAALAQPGDSVIVHEGVYREWVQSPHAAVSPMPNASPTALLPASGL